MGPWYEAWWRNKQDVHLHLLVISTSAIYKIKKSLNKIILGKKKVMQPGSSEAAPAKLLFSLLDSPDPAQAATAESYHPVHRRASLVGPEEAA